MRKHFGTHDDGEYLPLGTTGPWKIVVYLAQPLIIPVLAVLRFLVLAPLGWLIPSLRRWLHQHASSLVMDPELCATITQPQDVANFSVAGVPPAFSFAS